MGAEWDAVRIEILQVPGCPLVERVRETVEKVLARCEIRAEIEDLVGGYPSPTLLIDGRDVTSRSPGDCSACCFDLPSEEQVVAALQTDA